MQAKARTRLRAVLAGLTPKDLNLGPLLTGAAQTKLSWAKLVAVSYTHLDVYKRQPFHLC